MENARTYGAVLTVRQAMSLPVLSEGRCVAGEKGLDNRIRWVHIVDMPAAHYEWGKSGVLLLTTGYGLPAQPERQVSLVSKLVKEQFAGIVLSVGDHMKQTPAALAAQAEALHLPIIELPLHVNFVDVTEAIFQLIISRQYRLLQQSGSIHQRLTEQVLQGGDLDSLANTLATLLERSITIEDTSFRVLAAAQQGQVDEARQRSVSNGYATPELVDRLVYQGVYQRLAKDLAPQHVGAMPELGMTMERIVAPVVVAREVQGYIWIISGDRPLTDLDEAAIAHGATVGALVLLKQRVARAAEDALRGDFFEELLRDDIDPVRLSEQAHHLGFFLDQPHQVLLLHASPTSGGSPRSALRAVEQGFRQGWGQVLTVWREDELVAVIESTHRQSSAARAGELVEKYSQPACPLLVGMGELSPGGASLRTAYSQARDAVLIELLMGKTEGVADFEDLGCLLWLHRLPADALKDNRYWRLVQQLASYDGAHGRRLLHTLEVYLDCGGSLVDAAEALHVHRNTLLQRLERIESLISVDLRNAFERLNLHLALKCTHIK